MSDAVLIERHGSILVLSLNNPPVNGLGLALRTGISEALDQAEADDGITAVVIKGAGRMFSAGADITEFGTPRSLADPNLPSVCLRIENSKKPVVAAIHGVAAGGGLETALSCHYRVASAKTRLGLPEVTLGIIPGAGGTQRLPRLTGVEAALKLITSGELAPAAKAQKLGYVDELVEGDPLEAALAAAERLAANGALRRTMEIDDKIAEARANPAVFDEFAKSIAKKARGFDAPFACIDAVKAAATLPGPEGLAKEREIFKGLVGSNQAASQCHAFFAEREVAKIPDVPKDTPIKEIATAGVIGCGTMGGGITMNFANAGIPVTVVENDPAALDRGLETIAKNYQATVDKGRMTQEDMDARMTLITGATGMESLAEADIIVEAVFEEMDLKKQIFGALDRVAKPGAILATNTSMLDINVIAAATSRPESVIGTHFFSPANVMKLMENVRGEKTAPETIATVMDLSKKLKKIGVLVGVCDGFVGNRMLGPYLREAGFLLEEGALPAQVDKAIYDFGFPMGPFAMMDLAGNDVGWRIRKRQRAESPNNLRYSDIADQICELGRFGQKTGGGWHDYADGRTATPSAKVEEIVVETSKRLGIERREISDQEIIERCLYPLINEGAKVLEEGIAMRPCDIDIVWLFGYGFPRYRGGPMFYADTVGVKTIYDKMCAFHEQHGELMKPAPLLEKLAKEEKRFADL
jgi:3-hydroxyacyl-CoA dehydrogenase